MLHLLRIIIQVHQTLSIWLLKVNKVIFNKNK